MKIREKRTDNKNEEKNVILNRCSLHFNLRSPKSNKSTPLYAVLFIMYSDNTKKQYKLSLHVSLLPSNWDRKRETLLVNGTENEDTLKKLQNILTLINTTRLFFTNVKYTFASVEEVTGAKILNEIKKLFNYNKINKMNVNNLKINRGVTASKVLKKAFDEKYSEKSGMKKTTIDQQRYKLNRFLSFLKNTNVTDSAKNRLTIEGLKEYRNYLHKDNPNLSKSQSYKLIEFIASLTNYSILNLNGQLGINQISLNGMVKSNVIRNPKYDNKHVEILEDELKTLSIVTLETTELKEIRDLFLFDCVIGCRFSDLKKILNKDFEIKYDNNQKTLVYKTTKGENKSIMAVMPFDVNPLIESTINRILNDEFTVKANHSNFNKKIKEIFKTANINRKIEYKDPNGVKHSEELCNIITWHCCRVTSATRLLRQLHDVEFVARALGWADDSMLKTIYGRLNTDDEARSQIERLKKATAESPKATDGFDEVKDLKNALIFLGANYVDICDIKSISDLYVEVRKYEGLLVKKGVDIRVIKNIYNECIPLKQRMEKLQIACNDVIKNG